MTYGWSFHGLRGNEERIRLLQDSGWRYNIIALLLCASYDYVYENSNILKNALCSKDNNYDVHKFRNYNNYDIKNITCFGNWNFGFTNS